MGVTEAPRNRERWRRKHGSNEQAIERPSEMWLEMLRIEKWLPRLYEQRAEAARRLEDLDELIRDDEGEARRIRSTVK